MTHKQHHGAALIMAILIMALASTVAVFIASQQNLWTQQASNLIAGAQQDALSQSAIDWSRGILAEDQRNSDADHPGENWAKALFNLPVENASLSGVIQDQQGRFNLNNLIQNGRDSTADIAYYSRLLQQLQLPTTLINPLLDWLDEDNETHIPGGAEDSTYLTQTPPYRTANRLLWTLDELYRVQGYTPDIVAKLRPYVTALPEHTALNVNTAAKANLQALLPSYDETDLNALLETRKNAYFKSPQDFRNRLPKPVSSLQDELVATSSHYFLTTVRVSTPQLQTGMQALLARGSSKTWPRIVWQQQQIR